ncbi:alpha-ketoacid dehydrogenase subunit beta [Mycoplasma tauri]|uniref:Alpha-ketoacid dehydrogenase subunit beta n=1 Tax=Mycoplasma tauri TaxID=547987 RepID=A0A953NCC3_9MOLU|nr:alpha-ketoacid dehydrogenase subunit beta [Mycoplasma tauri]MBZ4195252.1 alpha-ketoacid dehydrogenase subunit beta [Mycoplasma tauri]MBZ4203649.1 alpha-ketoacid dehydrogenase subunit beta [Mycoplasma tauri]MBZ4204185.1 alpha-ketoacid dehydrogenase subunit beta [Mycoplasma tauri]MBZ4212583.1 alpha-ketoacid dehydrogenase subunit beta [Mycoplasma tauri]MBZ4218215.1 alpha-ketoacid dehydrogenase subunit beta [Mycoplasma tauri]
MNEQKISLNNIGAVTNALDIAMERDKNVVVYGEDVGFEGGVFRATAGLQKKYGDQRVWDAPISESAIAGSATGAALAGLRPVAEMQFSGFSFYAMGQIFSNTARYRNRSRGTLSCPVVFRMPCGGGVKALEHHSEALETLYAHIPGLKVVMPSTPYDTKGLLLAAIEDNDPVIFLEHKRIYRAFKQEVPAGHYTVEIGKANVMIPGDDLTVVTYGHMVHETIAALKDLNAKGKEYSIEVIDLRTIKPLDTETIVNSVKKTGRLLVVSEAVQTLSIATEIITRVNEHAFDDLLAAPRRLNAPDVTVPLPSLEPYFMVTKEKIATVIEEMLG